MRARYVTFYVFPQTSQTTKNASSKQRSQVGIDERRRLTKFHPVVDRMTPQRGNGLLGQVHPYGRFNPRTDNFSGFNFSL